MSSPRPVRALPWTWHHDNGHDEKCIAIFGVNSKKIIIPASQLREIADTLHDRADETETPNTPKENTIMTTFTEEQYDKLMIRAMTEARRADQAEALVRQHEGRINYLELLVANREEQLEQLVEELKEVKAR